MAAADLLHRILHIRKQYLTKLDADDVYDEILTFQEELLSWQQQMIIRLNRFVEEKLNEIKNNYLQSIRRQVDHLDVLYSNIQLNSNDQNLEESYSHLIDNVSKVNSSIKISFPKQIDFNHYCQLNTDNLEEIHRSLSSFNNAKNIQLSSYQLFSTLPTQSNATSLFAVHDRLLIYCDHDTSSASLHIFDLKKYLEHSNSKHSCLKARVPCTEFHGKVMHMEYCSYLKGFLIATGSKLFTIKITSVRRKYRITESFDIVQRNFAGILQKFVCHPITINIIYFLINKFSQNTLIRVDLDKNFTIVNQWDYPINDNIPSTKSNFQLKSINDFAVGNNVLIFSVTYESNDNSSDQYYEFHVRSFDMNLQHYLTLNTSFCPLRIYIIPQDYLSVENPQEQFMIISPRSKTLSLYGITSTNNNDKIQLNDEIILDTEPEYVRFLNNDLSNLLIRNLFHIAIYRRKNN